MKCIAGRWHYRGQSWPTLYEALVDIWNGRGDRV